MSAIEEVIWTAEQMVEVGLKEPDDFLKVRETLTRIGVASRKEKSYINRVTSFTNRVDITLYILKNCLLLMVRKQTCLSMMCNVGTA